MLDIDGLLRATYRADVDDRTTFRRVLPHLLDAYRVEEAWVGEDISGGRADRSGRGTTGFTRLARRNGGWEEVACKGGAPSPVDAARFEDPPGAVYVRFDARSEDADGFGAELVRLSRATRRIDRREDVRALAQRRLGQDLGLVGVSPPLLRLEHDIELAAASDLPAYVFGEPGTETTTVAFSIHALSRRAAQPIAVIDCPGAVRDQFESDLAHAVEDAQGGTLILHGIDQLSGALLPRLSAHLSSRSGQWINTGVRRRMADVRLVATSNLSSAQLQRRRPSGAGLVAELAYLPVAVPPLRDRLEDVEHLVTDSMRRLAAGAAVRPSPFVLEALRRYRWPGNVAELDAIIARIVTMSGGRDLDAAELADLAPELVRPCGAEAASAESWEALASRIAERDLSTLTELHPGLQRALIWLGENYAEEITTTDVARHAYISKSHLSHLFKEVIGVPVRTFLARLRIETAKRLLVEHDERRVTDIALEVGFGDFSHFLKSFKRAVGVTPRSYRQRKISTRDEEA